MHDACIHTSKSSSSSSSAAAANANSSSLSKNNITQQKACQFIKIKNKKFDPSRLQSKNEIQQLYIILKIKNKKNETQKRSIQKVWESNERTKRLEKREERREKSE